MINIVLVDDHQILRDGLKSILEDEDDLMVVGEADNGREALRLVRQVKPDIVVMDVSMPDINGIEATSQIMEECPGCKVLALSMHRDPRFITGMLEAGAKGYMLKDCASDELVSVIRTLSAGSFYVTPGVADVVIKGFLGKLGGGDKKPPGSVLSPREREVLKLLVGGLSTKEISDRICVGIKTVEAHRRNIMEKLEIGNLVDLIRYAIVEGITSIDEWLSKSS